MKNPSIYLAGPISGCTFKGCTTWRKEFRELMPEGVECLSPMRDKEYLDAEELIEHDYPDQVLSCQRGIMTRDFFDCTNATLIVVDLRGATRVSIGTVMEIAWAYATRTPVVAIMEPEGNLHDHPMVREAIGFRVETPEQAARVVRSILNLPCGEPANV